MVVVTVPVGKHVSVAKFEKMSKYKYLKIELEKLYHMKTVTIPVVIGTFRYE